MERTRFSHQKNIQGYCKGGKKLKSLLILGAGRHGKVVA